MKKITSLLAAIIAAMPLFAADWCSLRAVASLNGEEIEVAVVPEVDWNQSDLWSYQTLLVVYFYDEFMNPLESSDGLYEAANGQVAANTSYVLSSDNDAPVITLSIPLEQLHLTPGTNKLHYTVEMFFINNGEYESAAAVEPTLFELPASPIGEIYEPQPVYEPAPVYEPEPVYEPAPVLEEPKAEPKAEPKPEKKADKPAKKPAETSPVEKAVSKTFSGIYRYDWDEDLYEELQFSANGTVKLVRVFKIWDKKVVKTGTYIVYDGNDKQSIRIDWQNAGNETFTREGSGRGKPIFNNGKEWKAVQ